MSRKALSTALGRSPFLTTKFNNGFALPMALALGLVMIALSVTSALVAQGDRDSALRRKESGASVMISDSAIARALLELNKPNNGVLLTRNYDPINPKTGKTYLGSDGVPKSGDESTTALDEWTGYNPSTLPCYQMMGINAPDIALNGTIGTNDAYIIRAYRYNSQSKLGTLLVEGNYRGQSSFVAITLQIAMDPSSFPGVLSTATTALRGRNILGNSGNVVYNPLASLNTSLQSFSKPAASTRPQYLDAIWSAAADGASGDNVSGTISACKATMTVPVTPQGTDLGTVKTDVNIAATGGGITYYQIGKLEFNKSTASPVLNVDTTAGPVYIYFGDKSVMEGGSKIRNTRSDGQLPRVGDLRLIMDTNKPIEIYDNACIENAFVYAP
ncbi:MAG: hypothetical protein WCD18_17270 [Thermosynechococcaceae cyanobacterium]